jgi:hypothetical protein
MKTTLKQVNCHDIIYNPMYVGHAHVDKTRVAKLVAVFNENLVTPPHVVEQDGKYFVIEGAHTLAAMQAKYAGKPHPVLCHVYPCRDERDVSYVLQQRYFEGRRVHR